MTKRKRLYIAGPYRAKTINGIYNNIAAARGRAEWGWANGYFPICPHLNSAFIDGLVPDKDILECYLQLVDLCHAILMIDGWKESDGSRAELRRARKSGLEVISDPFILTPEDADLVGYMKQIDRSTSVNVDVDDILRYK